MSLLAWRSFAVAWIMLVLVAHGDVRAQSDTESADSSRASAEAQQNAAAALSPTAADQSAPVDARGAWPIAASL
ncbi:MAG TPA: hypothetical protein VMF89_36015, partial [Polyangiales bacterium]|nr:hypothetical protein [Polyangiales bacterium]